MPQQPRASRGDLAASAKLLDAIRSVGVPVPTVCSQGLATVRDRDRADSRTELSTHREGRSLDEGGKVDVVAWRAPLCDTKLSSVNIIPEWTRDGSGQQGRNPGPRMATPAHKAAGKGPV